MRVALGMVLSIFSLLVLLRLDSGGDPLALAWTRPDLPLLCNLAGLVLHVKAAVLDAWRNKVAAALLWEGWFSEWSAAGCSWLFAAP